MTAIGHDASRLDARQMATGAASFAADLDLPGMLHGRILRCPHAHARFARIDPHPAKDLPGVVATLIADDVLDVDPYHGLYVADRPLLAIDRARFAGEPVAAVAADCPAAAAKALSRIEIDYEELPATTTVDAALAGGAPRLHFTEFLRPGLLRDTGAWNAQPGNVCWQQTASWGEVERTFAGADLVVEGEYRIDRAAPSPFAPPPIVAHWTAEGLTVWCASAEPFLLRAKLARLFALPLASVRIVATFRPGPTDGDDLALAPLAAALARKARRPVRLDLTFAAADGPAGFPAAVVQIRTAATATGCLLARDIRVQFNLGAYAGDGPLSVPAEIALGPYRWQAARCDARGIYTNTPPTPADATLLAAIGEAQVDEIARRLGGDPLQAREDNLIRRGDAVPPGGLPLDVDLAAGLRRAAGRLGWAAAKPPGRGRGLAAVLLPAAGGVSTAVVRLDMDGRATLLTSAPDRGLGFRTVLGQIVAAELTLHIEHVTVPSVDTTLTPFHAGPSAIAAMLAAQRAARGVRAQFIAIAARLLDLLESALDLRDGALRHGDRQWSAADLIAARFGPAGGELIGHGAARVEPAAWTAAVAAVDIDLNPTSGDVIVHKAVTVADAGRVINPRLANGAANGAAVRGIAAALGEDPALAPDAINAVLVEDSDGPGPHGAWGTGDEAAPAVAAAAVAALAEAGLGVTNLPLARSRAPVEATCGGA